MISPPAPGGRNAGLAMFRLHCACSLTRTNQNRCVRVNAAVEPLTGRSRGDEALIHFRFLSLSLATSAATFPTGAGVGVGVAGTAWLALVSTWFWRGATFTVSNASIFFLNSVSWAAVMPYP